MALKVEDVIEVLNQKQLDSKVVSSIRQELEAVEEENKAARGTTPKAKNQFVIVVKGDESMRGKELAGWVLQIPEGDDVSTILSRVKNAATATVNNMRRRRRQITTLGQAIQYSKPAFLKENRVKVKTKEYVQALVVVDDGLDKIQ